MGDQRLGVLEYCGELGIAALTLVEDTVSSRKPWAERRLGEIASTAKSGDMIVVSEGDLRSFSRARYEHVNPCGKHRFDLDEGLPHGHLRPLREP